MTRSPSDTDSDSSEMITANHSDEDRSSKSRKIRSSQHEKDIRRKNEDQNNSILRKEMGLGWMLRPSDKPKAIPRPTENEPNEHQTEEREKVKNPKELNPYLHDEGSGHHNDELNVIDSSRLLSSSLVGDGGASWRVKALKRAKEQAAREGLSLQGVIGERFGSLDKLVTSVTGNRPAPAHAHLHAAKERKKGQTSMEETRDEVYRRNDNLHSSSRHHPEMKKPKHDHLQWRSKDVKGHSLEASSLVSEAISGANKFSNDGSFMDVISHQSKNGNVRGGSFTGNKEKSLDSRCRESTDLRLDKRQDLSSNQLAAKALSLRMKGKHEEAENFSAMEKQMTGGRKKHEDDADKHLAHMIMQNRRYSMSGNADDEYDQYDGPPSRKCKEKKPATYEEKISILKERCQFCFESPSRQKHLVISIGNTTYMMLPPWEPVLHGHCIILPLQHESATRRIDKNVWEEIRNFKKCLLKMFSRQDKDVIFIETVIELSKQRRHCLIDCIPISSDIAKQAPLYFKKAIDEAEDEWGQHDMKKVIPTSGNLRNVIPENFSYFHVEFGLDRGFVHVIDDDKNFPSSFGLNVVRGMLRLPEETMRHHQRRESVDKQKQAVAAFVREWEPFNWTRELD